MKTASLLLAAFLVSGNVLSQEPIKIGVITDKVGPAKPYAEPILQGIEFGVKEINARDGETRHF